MFRYQRVYFRIAGAILITAAGLSSLALAKKPGGNPPSPADFEIVYRELDSGSLFLCTADGAAHLQITATKSGGPGAALDESPTWSPSGQLIAFGRRPDRRETRTDLYLINADGSGESFVTTLEPPPFDANSAKEDTITWSPSEREIVYIHEDSIYAAELATGNIRQLAAFETRVNDLDISVIRGEMAFLYAGDIWSLPLSLDENELIVPFDLADMTPVIIDGGVAHPRYSPDGSWMACNRNKEELVVFDLLTADEFVVIPSSFSSEISWSPDGTRITYREIFTLTGGKKNVEVFTVDVLTGQTLNITNTSTMREEQSDWRPDLSLLFTD